jgi:hypothetical protein
LAFAKRDEFTKLHNSYLKEGLVLEFTPVYDLFKQAEDEYKAIQDRQAFQKQFNSQISQIDNGFLMRSPDDLIKVNINTKWKTNMVGGDNRIQNIKNLANAEAKKVKLVLETGGKFDLDVDSRLRAFNQICRIYEYSAEVIKKQIDKYMNITTEFQGLKKQYEGYENELYSGFNDQKDGLALSMLQQAYPYYLATYKYFYLPGFNNKYTDIAVKRLQELNALPKYRKDEMIIDKSWQLSIIDLADTSKVSPYTAKVGQEKISDKQEYSSLTIPSNSELVLSRTFDTKVPYDYTIANVASPYYNDSRFELNSEPIDFSFNPIDTLKFGNESSTRYALVFGEGKYVSGKNDIVMHFSNFDSNPLKMYLNLMVISDSVKIEAAMPVDTLTVLSDSTWEYVLYKEDKQLKNWKKSLNAGQFGLPKTQWYEMETSAADPIWVSQSDSTDTLKVVFQKEFDFNGILRDGTIKFIIPDIGTIKLNDVEITTDYLLNYDAESHLVFAGQITMNSGMLKQGKNTLQVVAKNSSQWKGIVFEMIMTVAHPDGGVK